MGWVVQGPADSKIPVKSRGRQEEGLSGAHGEEGVELEEADKEMVLISERKLASILGMVAITY